VKSKPTYTSTGGISGRKLLVIGAGPLQAPAIAEAKRMGLTVVATDMYPDAPGFALADGHAVISTLDVRRTVEYAAREKVRGAMTLATDIPLVTVAAVNSALGLSGVTPAVARRATNKYEMIKAFAAAGVPCPRFSLASSPARAVEAAEKIGWPVVTKPLVGSASRGVVLAGTPGELEAAFAAAREVAGKRQVLIEEYARGKHICAEAFTWKGRTRILCVIDRAVSRPPNFVELRHTFPSSLGKKRLAEAVEAAIAGISALGIEDGPSHIDMIVTERGPVISEIGARLDGDYKSSHLMPVVFGYNIIADTIRAAMGETPLLFERNIEMEPGCALCISYFTPRPGVVKSVAGVREAKRAPGVKHFELHLKPGAQIARFRRSQDRVGVVIVSGKTAKEASASAKATEGRIEIIYE
jgi:biotin carboxylase